MLENLCGPSERIVDGWTLRSNAPIVKDRQSRQLKRALRPAFPFGYMDLNESFDCTPQMLGLEPCHHCGDTRLLETANIVSRAASHHKTNTKDLLGNLTRDFKTAQIGGAVRCQRIL